MASFYKKVFFSFSLFFSALLFADGVNVGVQVSNASVNESEGTISFTVTVDELPLSIFSPVHIDYQTINGSAISGTDYTAKSSNVFTAIWFTSLSPSTSKTVTIDILDDAIHESNEYFYLQITTPTSGYSVTGTGKALGTIIDDDVDKSVTVNVSCESTNEGNIGDNNNISCRIFLDKPLPVGEPNISIDYETAEASYYTATPNVDYTPIAGNVLFITGDEEKIIQIPIIGDLEIEHNEALKLVISGSPDIDNSESELRIWDDDGDFPVISFEHSALSIVEGNSSQTFLEANIILDNPALVDSSFTYGTWNETAENQWGDNDYIYTQNDVNFTGGETYFTIKVPINGDTKMENDEVFHIGFWNLYKLNWGGLNEQIQISIINDDGSLPSIKIDMPSYEIYEGNSTQRELNITLSLDKPALPNSSIEFYTFDGSAESSNNDYETLLDKHIFTGGETTLSIPISIKGDTQLESHESFYFKIHNEVNISIDGSNTVPIIILNDDLAPLSIKNIGEFRFDDCGNEEWKIDNSPTVNHALGTATGIMTDDDKDYMCTSLNGYQSSGLKIPHHADYALTEGTVSMLLYDHHNIWASDSWLFKKGLFDIEAIRVGGDLHKGSIDVHLNGNTIHTNEVFFTNSDGGDSDTQWVHVTFTFGGQGMKLYINGELKGSNPYTGGIENITDDITMSTLSGYYDEFYIFQGQMGDNQVTNLYQNTISNKNIDGTLRDCGCEGEDAPFICDDSMYISSSVNRDNPTSTNKMWLHKVDTTKNPFDFIVLDSEGSNKMYNALAYADSGDTNISNYIFGLYKKELVKISKTGKVISLGNISELPSILTTKQLFAGAIYANEYYISGPGQDYEKIFKINLSDKSVSEITLDKAISLLDFSFTPDGKYLHGIIDGGALVKIDVATGIVSSLGSPHTGYQFDSTFSDANGRFFANDSLGNGFFEFNLNTGEKFFLSASQEADFNDGTNCLTASLVFTDRGDAPISYGTPRHNIDNGIFMGTEVDHDIHSYHNVDATGDDLNGTDDDDGVNLANGSNLNGAFLDLNTSHDLKIKVSKAGYLNAWIDYNIDGDFDDIGEKIFTGLALTTGTHTLSVNVNDGLIEDTKTYLRFRYSSTATLNATESASDGEVEDYAIYFGSSFKPLLGTFNIERTNSGLNPIINSEARNAWYTQIVGRDFDYSVLFYDENMTQEKALDNVTIKVELLDDVNQKVLYRNYYHIKNNPALSRINALSGVNVAIDDLAMLPAHKDVRFRITYGLDEQGGILQADCNTAPKTCFNAFTNIAYNDAKDDFSIRPERFFIKISDGNSEKISSEYPNHNLRVAAGYDYNLSMVATKYLSYDSALDYNKSFSETFDFNNTGLTHCANTTGINQNITFANGVFNSSTFMHDNVGKYHVTLTEDEDWAEVDRVKGDCELGKSTSATLHSNQRSGCNIAVKQHGIDLTFYPFQFKVDLAQHNLPNNSHPDFIYMSPLNQNYYQTGMQFKGEIVAQGKNNVSTSNFSHSCMAKDLLLTPLASLKSEDGLITAPKTILTAPIEGNHSREEVNIIRMERFNNEDYNLSNYNTLAYVTDELNITADKFLDGKNGSVELDLRYNIQKHLTQPINPINIKFDNIHVKSDTAYSETNKSTQHVPKGEKNFNGIERNFYFTQVASDLLNYPRIYFKKSKVVRTPLNVDIFCNAPKAYCQETGILNNTVIESSPRKQQGWYLSVNHDQSSDGEVTSLTPNPNVVNISPIPVKFSSGRNGVVLTSFNNCTIPSTKISIGTDPVLDYHPQGMPPYYVVNCTNQDDSQWTGIGESGNIIKSKAGVHSVGKMDW
ncbi:MAG: Unknown protein [uncultured Sulfurovum sp.]|uniref:Uncharacterized protein n=1 Tax=uncultured Sulfurovum sp. TaxID=269237 RepID=A0A6S6TJZ4_9BACT|nr:MAG: Unknown protein [uncultured Sulfurovum sp.]